MHHYGNLLPDAADVPRVRSIVHGEKPIYSLKLNDTTTIQTSDPHVARDYFAALAQAAEMLLDAADNAILALPLDVAS